MAAILNSKMAVKDTTLELPPVNMVTHPIYEWVLQHDLYVIWQLRNCKIWLNLSKR